MLTALWLGAVPLVAGAVEWILPGKSLQQFSANALHAISAESALLLKLDRTLMVAQFVPAPMAQRQLADAASASPSESQADGHSEAPPNTKGVETLLLEVRINGVVLPEITRVDRLTDGRLLLPLDAWTATRLAPPAGGTTALSDHQLGYAVQDVPGLSFALDRSLLTLTLAAPASAFLTTEMVLGTQRTKSTQPSTPGVFLNYDASISLAEGNRNNIGVLVEGVAFNGPDSLVSGAVLINDGLSRQTIRTETYWRRDLPGSMEALVLGDTIGSGGAWSRPVRYGGIRFARDFSLAPGYVTHPMPSLQGSAALPSTVDVIVNNQRRSSLNVGPGPFDLSNVPVVSGSGEVNLVVRDLRGVETVITQKYYLSPRLLAYGLSDYSLDAGRLRRNFGQPDSGYGPGFAAAAYRYGLTPALTAEGRIEAQKERQAVGIEAAGLLGNLAAAQAAVAWSRNGNDNDRRSLDRSGGRYLLALERSAPLGGNGSLQYEHFDAGFRQFGDLGFEARPRDRTQAQTGISLGRLALGVSYTRQTTWEGDNFRLVAMNIGSRIFDNVYLSLYASKRLGPEGGWNAGLNVILPLEKQRTIIATSNRDEDGRFTTAVQASQSPPIGPGWGWSVRSTDQARQHAQAGVILNSSVGQFQAEVNTGSGTNALRVGAGGSVGWLAGLPFATRRIDHGAFAVVRVADLEGVPVYRSNQVAATTNKKGLALVTGLLPYQANKLTIDPDELPFNTEIKGVEEVVTPYARSGILVDFQVRRTRNALVVINQPNGSPIPSGAVVTLLPGKGSFVMGKRGEAYLTDLSDSNRLRVTWKDSSCELALDIDSAAAIEPRIGPLICPTGK